MIRYVPDVREETGIDFAVVAVSESEPRRIALKHLRSWARVLEVDVAADVELLNALVSQLPAHLEADTHYLDRALKWENCVRVLPPTEVTTGDFEVTFALVADAVLGIEE